MCLCENAGDLISPGDFGIPQLQPVHGSILSLDLPVDSPDILITTELVDGFLPVKAQNPQICDIFAHCLSLKTDIHLSIQLKVKTLAFWN